MINFEDILNNVPDYKTFLTVDELDKSTWDLAEKFPDTVKVFEVGKSRKNHPILCSKIGNGEKNALCFALPHPNEPIGAMMIEYLSSYLAENPDFCESTGYTWYFMKCVDPDGTKLNEGWFKGPYTIHNYMKNFFRPGSIEQVEWTFPIKYKDLIFESPMPETQAIMKVIEEVKPEFLYSLHNAGFGGAYWYITHEYEDIYQELRDSALKQDIALHLGEPESPSSKVFSDAIYQMLGMEEEYDYIEKYSGVSPTEVINCGTCSSDYASKYNDCVTLLTELPYFFDKRIQNLEDSNLTRREAIEISLKNSDELVSKMDEILSILRPVLSKNNPFPLLAEQLVESHVASSQAKREWAKQEEFSRKATIAEEIDSKYVGKFYSGLCIAMLARAAKFERDRLEQINELTPELEEELIKIENETNQYIEILCDDLEKNLNYEVISIQRLVKVQLESGLIVSQRRREY